MEEEYWTDENWPSTVKELADAVRAHANYDSRASKMIAKDWGPRVDNFIHFKAKEERINAVNRLFLAFEVVRELLEILSH